MSRTRRTGSGSGEREARATNHRATPHAFFIGLDTRRLASGGEDALATRCGGPTPREERFERTGWDADVLGVQPAAADSIIFIDDMTNEAMIQ